MKMILAFAVLALIAGADAAASDTFKCYVCAGCSDVSASTYTSSGCHHCSRSEATVLSLSVVTRACLPIEGSCTEYSTSIGTMACCSTELCNGQSKVVMSSALLFAVVAAMLKNLF